MKNYTITINNIGDYPRAAREFVQFLDRGSIFAFYGKMGSGKTTLIKSICEALGVEDAVNSPTFAIVNEYEDREQKTIYHFDFYRIKSLEEVYNMGYEEYFYSGATCFIEWPELVAELLPEDCVKVFVDEIENGTRVVKIVAPEQQHA